LKNIFINEYIVRLVGTTMRVSVMNAKFRYLSNKLYGEVSKRYQSKTFPNIIFDRQRMDMYGRNILSYTGHGESMEISKIVKDYVSGKGVCKDLFHEPKFYLSEIDIHKAWDFRTSTSVHMFLKVKDKNNKIIVIDPTYKQFLYNGNGRIDKWFSPYMQHLFNLDPVFIGTENELEQMLLDLKKRRNNDCYHWDDELIDNRYTNIKEYVEDDDTIAMIKEKMESTLKNGWATRLKEIGKSE
jgi:heat shock protein HspQ